MRHEKPYESILDLIGNTPLLHLNALQHSGDGEIYAKIEYMNPGGSIKDRAALGMIIDAEEKGLLKKGSVIIEPTAGNTGIALALIGISRGYRVIIVMPEKFSKEKRYIARALGGEVVLTPSEEGMQGAIRKAREIARQIPLSYVPQQFENQANPDIHYHTTGREIYEQMGGNIDAIVIGVGTGGTLTGIARYLRERINTVKAFLVEPEGSIFGGGCPGPHRVEGIGNDFIPATLDLSLVDSVVTVSDDDSFKTVRELARKEGLLVGSSSGTNVFAALKVAHALGKGKRIVTVLPDGSERYMSKDIFGFDGDSSPH